MGNEDFFENPKEGSLIKARFVSKYAIAWARVLASALEKRGSDARVRYVDLYCGPGVYGDDSQPSTPILILRDAIKIPVLTRNLSTFFNDEHSDYVQELRLNVASLAGVGSLHHAPKIDNQTVGADLLASVNLEIDVPTLVFADPWGYKGLSLGLIDSAMNAWGSECIFFFNYRRINAALGGGPFEKHMVAIFGEERFKQLRTETRDLNAASREKRVVEQLTEALKADTRGEFVQPFRFSDEKGTRTSHYIFHVCKHVKGHNLMKEIMGKEGLKDEDGVPSYEFRPDEDGPSQIGLFKAPSKLEKLKSSILQKYEGQSTTVSELIEEMGPETPYLEKNFKQVLLELETQGQLEVSGRRKADTMPNTARLKFK